jgi:hypothetical protein
MEDYSNLPQRRGSMQLKLSRLPKHSYSVVPEGSTGRRKITLMLRGLIAFLEETSKISWSFGWT